MAARLLTTWSQANSKNARTKLAPLTFLAPAARRLGLQVRWLLVLLAFLLYIVDPAGSESTLALGAATLVLSLVLTALDRVQKHPGLIAVAPLDCLLIGAALVARGPQSDVYLLFTLVIIYLSMAYAWGGALIGLALSLLTYAGALIVGYSTLGTPPGSDVLGAALLRGIYFTITALCVSLVVKYYQGEHSSVEKAQERLGDQLRRLHAIQRITQSLVAQHTPEAVNALIVRETRGVINYGSCRIYMAEEVGGQLLFRLAGSYGEPGAPVMTTPQPDLVRPGEGLIGWVAVHGKPLLVDNTSIDPRASISPDTPCGPDSFLAVPVRYGGQVRGVIALCQGGTEGFTPEDLQLMTSLGSAAGIALENIAIQRQLTRQAETDATTGLPHHGAFLAALGANIEAARIGGFPLALTLVDLDGFRSYNDRLGLAASDGTLRQVGIALRRVADEAASGLAPGERASAAAFRVGGDEFALLLSGALAGSERAAELAGTTIAAIGQLFPAEPLLRITASAGLVFFPANGATRQELVTIADASLYLAKRTGGNRVGMPDDAALEMLQLRRSLEEVVQKSLAEAGSVSAAHQLVANAASVRQGTRLATVAEQLTTEALLALAAAIDAKDDYTRGHSERVAAVSSELARHMGCASSEIEQINAAARMHDIGKIGVPDHILHKRGPLSEAEQAVIITHPGIGADILAPIHTLDGVVPFVRHHHERFDGNGYPDGLKGCEIPFGARVLAVADAIDTMITDRPYRRGMDLAIALAELERQSGTQFDPAIAECALKLYSPGGEGLALRGVIRPTAVPAVPPGSTALDVGPRPAPVTTPIVLRPLRNTMLDSQAPPAGEGGDQALDQQAGERRRHPPADPPVS